MTDRGGKLLEIYREVDEQRRAAHRYLARLRETYLSDRAALGGLDRDSDTYAAAYWKLDELASKIRMIERATEVCDRQAAEIVALLPEPPE